jgi:flagella basal body P-ring formation protein FlgA
MTRTLQGHRPASLPASWAAAVLALAAFPAVSHAATLRPMALLQGPTVRLSDLFDGVGLRADTVLGPAPAPGGRIIVEAAQAAAIARQFGVDWRPATGAEAAVLERPGEPVPRGMVLDALREAITNAGADADAELEMTGFNPPLMPPHAAAQASVTQLDWDRTSGRFTALLSVTGAGAEPVNLRISGRALATEEVVVPTRRVAMGEVLQPSDIKVARVRTMLVHADVALSPIQAAGLSARRALQPGLPVALSDLTKPSLVRQRGTVIIELETPGMTLSVQGTALEGGAMGDHVKVLNPNSKAVMDAEVIGDGRVRVSPGSTPLVPAARNAPGFGQ